MAWDVIVRTFFSDGGLSAGLAKANAQLNELRRAGPGARDGLKLVEVGARQLAFEAAGLQGGIGQVVRGLLLFGGGSALVLGAVAGIGAIATAYRFFTKGAREAADAESKLRDEIVRSAAARASAKVPESQQIGADIASGRELLTAENERRRQLVQEIARQYRLGNVVGYPSLSAAIRADPEIIKIDERRSDLSLAIARNRRASADAAEREAAAERRLRDEMDERLQVYGGPTGGKQELLFGARIPKERLSKADLEEIMGVNRPGRIARGAGGVDAARLTAESLGLLAALRSGGAGGVLAGGGGILGSLSKIKGDTFNVLGIALSGVGAFISLFDRGAERRHREEMDKLTRLIQNTDTRGRPQNITLSINGREITAAILPDLSYALQHLARVHGEPVLPPR